MTDAELLAGITPGPEYADLAARCRDLVEWWDTGILPDGALRQFGEKLVTENPAMAEFPGAARYAEDRTEDQAVRLIAAAPTLADAIAALRATIGRLTRERDEARAVIERAHRWLGGISVLDMDELVADGGITAGMVVQQEGRAQASRLRTYLERNTE